MTRTARRNPTRVYCTSVAPAARFRRLEAAGVEVVRVRARGGRVALAAVLDDLGRRGASNLLVEGGAEVLGSFLDDGLADELRIHIAPRVIGGRTAPGAVGGRGPARLADALALTAFDLRRLGSDLELRAILKA